jgi:hypothetical protein
MPISAGWKCEKCGKEFELRELCVIHEESHTIVGSIEEKYNQGECWPHSLIVIFYGQDGEYCTREIEIPRAMRTFF